MGTMPGTQQTDSRTAHSHDHEPELKDVVLGLHWDPPDDAVRGQPADLDALCVLCDRSGRMLEVIHPGHPRTVDGSVIHTGDSRTGASAWDDERIFVFLGALPAAVSRVTFLVLSATGKPFDAVPGAVCHVSDRISEIPRVRVDLTALRGRTAHVIATLDRDGAGWHVAADVRSDERELFAELRQLVGAAK